MYLWCGALKHWPAQIHIIEHCTKPSTLLKCPISTVCNVNFADFWLVSSTWSHVYMIVYTRMIVHAGE